MQIKDSNEPGAVHFIQIYILISCYKRTYEGRSESNGTFLTRQKWQHLKLRNSAQI